MPTETVTKTIERTRRLREQARRARDEAKRIADHTRVMWDRLLKLRDENRDMLLRARVNRTAPSMPDARDGC
jgi:hypothetical protein